MNFFMDVTGVITNSIPVNVNQGGDDAYSINLYTPFTPGAVVTASFRLPNGEIKSLYALTYKGVATDVKVNGADVYLWTLTLPGDITRYYGTVTMQFFVTFSNRTLASTSTSFVVGRGVPQVIEDSSPLDTILENIAALQSDLDNGYFAARAIRPWNDLYTYGAGEIVWYPDIGEHGAFVESLVSNNTAAPYVDNEINSEYWEEEINFNNITDEFYSQIRALVDEAQTAADNAAESAEQAAQVAEDIGSLADRTVQIVTEVPSAENADPDVIYAVVVNADNNLFELYALVGGEMKDLGGANFVSNGTEVSLVTLRAAGWSENKQTVEVNNASPGKHMSVSVVDSSAADYINNGVTCSEMGSGTLTFTCERVPDNDINVLCVLDTTNIVPSLADYYTMPQVDKLLSDLKADSDSADDALQSDIAEEAQAREAADTTLQNNINAEATARTEADTALGGRIDDVVDGTTPVAKATSATNDGSGNNITSTYATKTELNNYVNVEEVQQINGKKTFKDEIIVKNGNGNQRAYYTDNGIEFETSNGDFAVAIQFSAGEIEGDDYQGKVDIVCKEFVVAGAVEDATFSAQIIKEKGQRVYSPNNPQPSVDTLTGISPSTADNGKVIGVVNGAWALVDKMTVTTEANSAGGTTYTIA